MAREVRTDTDELASDVHPGADHGPQVADRAERRLLADGGDERRETDDGRRRDRWAEGTPPAPAGIDGQTPEYADGSPEGETGSEDLAELLRDPHTRYMLQYLKETNEDAVELPRVADHVAAKVTNSDPDAVSDRVSRRVETWLHSGLVPELADQGVVFYDAETDRVGLQEDADV